MPDKPTRPSTLERRAARRDEARKLLASCPASKTQLAAAADITRSALGRWESGDVTPNEEQLARLRAGVALLAATPNAGKPNRRRERIVAKATQMGEAAVERLRWAANPSPSPAPAAPQAPAPAPLPAEKRREHAMRIGQSLARDGYTLETIARAIGYAPSTVSAWTTGTYPPSTHALDVFATYRKKMPARPGAPASRVGTGRGDQQQRNIRRARARALLRTLTGYYQQKVARIAHDLHVTPPAVALWMSGDRVPGVQQIAAIEALIANAVEPAARAASSNTDQLFDRARTHGITQRTIATWCGVSDNTVSHWRNGDRPLPDAQATTIRERLDAAGPRRTPIHATTSPTVTALFTALAAAGYDTDAALAEATGYNPRKIAGWRRGHAFPPVHTAEHLARLAGHRIALVPAAA